MERKQGIKYLKGLAKLADRKLPPLEKNPESKKNNQFPQKFDDIK